MSFFRSLVLAIVVWSAPLVVSSQVHTTYLWHLEQPNYWPETSTWNPYQYQKVWESNYLKFNNGNQYGDGLQHPLNNLQEIFGNDDRKAVYQYRAKDAVQSLLGHPEAGAQVSYSGCLMENVKSLSDAGQWGYSSGWENNFITARGWTTSAGKPRMDMVGFSMNHALSPLVSEKLLRKQIQAHRYLSNQLFGTSPNYSKGYWPAEGAFSERIIKALVEEGFEWSIIANSHLARTLSDYPLQFGTSGCNIDPPNAADKVSAAGTNWWSGQIDGRGGAFAAPYCYQAHKAKYVDPSTGTEFKIDVVPMCDLLSYQNGYSLMGTGDIDAHIAPFNNPSQPSIVLLAHDGDNAWGGGYDYYSQSVPGFANEAASKGYVPTTIQHFLSQHPVPESDLVHVEDGSWFNAANDWGHPQFINWIWPMYTPGYQFDPNGWTEDARNWAVLIAAENRVQMAEDLQGSVNIANIVQPSGSANAAEQAWHHLLPAYNSGYMYYGTSLDMEVKQTLACNIATGFANQVINAHPSTDLTPPTVFIPQRYPYNPGSIGFGPNYSYQQHMNSSDFFVWTFAYDVSGIQTAVLKYRLDNDGNNPIGNNDNETYAGGSGVQPWQSINMSFRAFPTGNVTNNPDISFFILPDYIAGEYYGQVTGLTDTLVDYYVEITDIYGNISKSPIQHVFVGSGGESGTTGLTWSPQNPTANDVITITESPAAVGAKLHWGVNAVGSSWQSPITSYQPSGSVLFNNTGPAVESPMAGPSPGNANTIQIGPFNNPAQVVNAVDFVLHYNNNTWNNNNGLNFHIPILPTADTMLSVSPLVQNLPAAAGTLSLSVISNTIWTAVTDQGWCTTGPGGSGSGSLTIQYTPNPFAVARVAHVTVSGTGALPVVVTLTQEAAILPDFLLVMDNDQQTSDRSFEFDLLLSDFDIIETFELGGIQAGISFNPAIVNGGEVSVEIIPGTSTLSMAQVPLNIDLSQEGNLVKLATVSPPGAGNGTLISTDPYLPDRVCRIRISNTVPFGPSAPDLAFNFTLRPYATLVSRYIGEVNTLQTTNTSNCYSLCSNEVLNAAPFLAVNPPELMVGAIAGEAVLNVTTNAAWTAESSVAWCQVTASGYGNGNITVDFEANALSASRNSTITITVAGLTPVLVTLTQEGNTGKQLALQVLLEGLYQGAGTMNPVYGTSGNYWGTGIADHVTVELHNPSDYGVAAFTIPGIELHTDGSALVQLPAGISGSYFITVRHRNSIETVSANPVNLSSPGTNYAFDNPSKAYGGNLKHLEDGSWVIWSGDVNQDGLVNPTDMNLVYNASYGFITGYVIEDLNGDGLVDASDLILLDNNAATLIQAELPE
ncbi:MAG: hypothetical protein IPH45_08275 [Bacteroidales bacterium]|nr:hypothetical protein [Bacteroidales bacterium]